MDPLTGFLVELFWRVTPSVPYVAVGLLLWRELRRVHDAVLVEWHALRTDIRVIKGRVGPAPRRRKG
jgi:hypothetical protein